MNYERNKKGARSLKHSVYIICRNICRSTLIKYQTPSVALAPLALIYRATHAVQQSLRQRSSGVWVLLLN